MDPLSFLNSLMSPLGREFCIIYFVFGLVALFGSIVLFLYGLSRFFDKDKRSGYLGLAICFQALNVFLIYILNRLLYTICMKSL